MAGKNNKERRILVTSALPYANGPIHVGHLVEYIQTDVWVRFLKLAGEDAVYCCADDTHGAPIELNASKQRITPEELIAKSFKDHVEDFKNFHIKFDSYYTTNSPENKKFSDYFFEQAKKKGLIYTKDVELTYCQTDRRFLPDRFVKGKCPKCEAVDQYGDVCEKCNSAYNTIDLIEPKCVICGNAPVRKNSMHYFFRLSRLSDKLEKWLRENENLQDEVRNFVLNWIKEGLRDWDISRDGPYFGFKIPGEEDKYYYVWLDAPIGYVASTENYAKAKGLDAEKDFWKNENCEITHFIGKDIIYFHFLFWPALLMAADFNLPKSLVVHGFLTVNGEKMSKSRGTFLTAKDFLKKYDAEYLRYYYAANLSRKLADIDLSFKDLHDRVNNELVANIANFSYRTLSMLNNVFGSGIGDEIDDNVIDEARKNYDAVKDAYIKCDFREAVKKILFVSSIGNKYFQDNEPWKLAKGSDEEKEKAHEIISTAANIARDLCILLKPIMPEFSEKLEKQLGFKDLKWENLNEIVRGHKINKAEIIIRKIEEEKKEVKGDVKVEETSKTENENKTDAPEEKKEGNRDNSNNEINFGSLNVKVGEVESVENHPNADRLLLININLGSEKRQIVAGLRGQYTNDALVGKKLCIVTNLERAKLRGVESQAMLLACVKEIGEDEEVGVLYAEKSNPGDQVYVDGISPDKPGKEVSHKDFQKIALFVKDGKPVYDGKALKTDSEEIKVDKGMQEGKIR